MSAALRRETQLRLARRRVADGGDAFDAMGGYCAPMAVRVAMGAPEVTDFGLCIPGISRRDALARLDEALAELGR